MVALDTSYRTLPLSEMEARITRFNARVETAQCAQPPTKHWVKEALRRRGGARCPIRLKRLSYDTIVSRRIDRIAWTRSPRY